MLHGSVAGTDPRRRGVRHHGHAAQPRHHDELRGPILAVEGCDYNKSALRNSSSPVGVILWYVAPMLP